MKAMVYTEYGSPDVLHLKEVAKPTPKDDQVLVKVHATALNTADWYMLRGDPFLLRLEAGLRKPKINVLGADIAGRVEAVGSNVKQFKPGDAVFGDLSGSGWGGLAEYVCVPANVLVMKPASVTFEEAAAIPMAAVTALQGLRDKAKVQSGEKVLINGASGGVGSYAVQIACYYGAEVTAVCSTKNLDMARSIGANHVIDYTREDFTKNGQQYDLIFAVNGNCSLFDYRRALNPTGKYVCAGGKMKQVFQGMLLGPILSRFGSKKMGSMGVAQPNTQDLVFMGELVAARKVKPVIDSCYPLSKTAEALRYLGEVHPQGKVVIMVAHEGN